MKILIGVDLQKDFFSGVLGSKEAMAILPKIVKKFNNIDKNTRCFLTKDTHGEDYLQTQEGKNLPVVHTVFGKEGWEFEDGIWEAAKENLNTTVILKHTFGSIELVKLLLFIHEHVEKIDSIELIGVCTGICVISNALIIKAYFPEIPIIVDASCCACVTPESHKNALKAMKMCQINIIND